MTGVLVDAESPLAGRWLELAAARSAVVFVTAAGLPVTGGVAVYHAADAYGWSGTLVATCPATLRLMTALPVRGPRELWLAGLDGLGEGWEFVGLRAALAAVRVVLPDEQTAARFRSVWRLPADVGQ